MANTTHDKALIRQGDEMQISEQVDIRSMIHTIRGRVEMEIAKTPSCVSLEKMIKF